jgi:hypothetical protein
MPDFPPGFVYAAAPIDALYWRYSLRCRVEREEDKAYYWPQLAKIHEAISTRACSSPRAVSASISS